MYGLVEITYSGEENERDLCERERERVRAESESLEYIFYFFVSLDQISFLHISEHAHSSLTNM